MVRKVLLFSSVSMLALVVMWWLATADGSTVRRPLFDNPDANKAVAAFRVATVIPSYLEKDALPGDYREQVWDASLSVTEAPTLLKVSGKENFSVITVHYRDGKGDRRVHEPADYSNNIELRVGGSTLYVYRRVALLWTEYRLAVFDLIAAEQKSEFLVDPDELPELSVR